MTTAIQISCIHKTNRLAIHERIKSVGGIHAAKRWELTVAQAIAYIKNGTYSFFVQVGVRPVRVIIATSAAGYEYLKTEADSTTVNNLLSLNECPI